MGGHRDRNSSGRVAACSSSSRQDGVVTRRQLLAEGITDGQIRARLKSHRWRAIYPGVYMTLDERPSALAMTWAAVLRAGPGAVAGPRTSLWLAGAYDEPPARLDVLVPDGRTAPGNVPFQVRRCRHLPARVHPAARPPRLRVDDAVLDLCQQITRPDLVVDLVIRVVQRRLTTASRLRERTARRRRQRWRALLLDVLGDVERGVLSSLERRWLRHVEIAHGLPSSKINHREDGEGGRTYRDFDYDEYGLVVETDGREAHSVAEAFRDRIRDNRVTVSGRRTLRYGWHEIVRNPCAVAEEVATVLRMLGWSGHPRPCGPQCVIARDRRRDRDKDPTR
jgi:very-short-patch-repair endonuclease